MPRLERASLGTVEAAVLDYLEAAKAHEQPLPLRGDDARQGEMEHLRNLHWHIDAEILRLYDLPLHLERGLVDFFAGWDRVGVPFKQDRYYPEGFDEPISLADFLAITAGWELTNERRLELIDKKGGRTIGSNETEELQRLQRLAGLKRELLSSPSLKELAEMEADMRRRGVWRGD
jgi:hypothetical protein